MSQINKATRDGVLGLAALPPRFGGVFTAGAVKPIAGTTSVLLLGCLSAPVCAKMGNNRYRSDRRQSANTSVANGCVIRVPDDTFHWSTGATIRGESVNYGDQVRTISKL